MKKQNSNNEDSNKKVISSTIILEMIGAPQEHLVKTLKDLIEKMGEEKGVKVINKKINEPIVMKSNEKFYTTFAEVDLEVEDILYLAIIMFKYMPAHVEVIEPELIALTNNGWTEILSELTRRLHAYEEVARVLQFQNSKMQKKLKELLPDKEDNKENKKVKDKQK